MDEAKERRSSTTGMALGTIISASAAPYGYTVSLWSSGALLIHFRGAPDPGEVFLFAMGALVGFTVVGLSAAPALRMGPTTASLSERALSGALHWFSVGAATGAVALIAQIPGAVAWPLGAFAATTLYLFCSSLELAFVASRRTRR